MTISGQAGSARNCGDRLGRANMVPTMNRATLTAYVVSALTIVGGGFLAKYVSPEAGSGLAALGGMLAGKVMQQPGFVQSKAAPSLGSEEPTNPKG